MLCLTAELLLHENGLLQCVSRFLDHNYLGCCWLIPYSHPIKLLTFCPIMHRSGRLPMFFPVKSPPDFMVSVIGDEPGDPRIHVNGPPYRLWFIFARMLHPSVDSIWSILAWHLPSHVSSRNMIRPSFVGKKHISPCMKSPPQRKVRARHSRLAIIRLWMPSPQPRSSKGLTGADVSIGYLWYLYPVPGLWSESFAPQQILG